MAKQIIFTDKANSDIETLLNYLITEISERYAEKFVKQLYKKVEWISKYPDSGQISSKSKTVRSVKIDKYRKMFYRPLFTTVFILHIFDTRQDPDKSPY
jgi:plasmid stabilization system protein ParE